MNAYTAALAAALACALPAPLLAATYTATPETIAAVWKSVAAGDTINLVGVFPETVLRNRSFATPVTLNAAKASFPGALTFNTVENVRLVGGSYGSLTAATRTGNAIGIYASRNVSISRPVVSGFLGMINAKGVTIDDSAGISVQDGRFTGMKVGISASDSRNLGLRRNSFTGLTSDGINIASSTSVTASGNSCSGFTVIDGTHPDCIQLWSVVGGTLNSRITLSDNRAVGDMQGFTSFNPETGGTLLVFTRNYVEVTYPQGIACYSCTSSSFTDNTLVTPALARWRTSLNVVGGARNTISGNFFIDRRALGGTEDGAGASLTGFDTPGPYTGPEQLPDPLAEVYDPIAAFDVADGTLVADGEEMATPALAEAAMRRAGADSGLDAGIGPGFIGTLGAGSALGAVPEPATWLQLVAGFALAGVAARRARFVPAAARRAARGTAAG